MPMSFLRPIYGAKGITLLELLIVLAIIAIMASVAIPGYLGGMPRRRLNSSSMDVASNLKLARMKAVSTGTNWGVLFDNINNLYTVFQDTSQNDQYDAGEEDSAKLNLELETGITISGTTFANNTTIFQPNGTLRIVAGGTGPPWEVTLTNGSETRNIDVATTGRVRICPPEGC